METTIPLYNHIIPECANQFENNPVSFEYYINISHLSSHFQILINNENNEDINTTQALPNNA